MATKKKAVAKRQTTAIADMSMFKKNAAKQRAQITSDDITIPRLAILQSLSPQLIESKPEYIEGAHQGDIVDTATKKVWSKDDQPITVLVSAYKREFIEWQPRKKGGGLVDIHPTDDCLLDCEKNEEGTWITDDGNEIHPTAQYFVLNLSDNNRPAFISMSRTQLKYSKNWMNALLGQVDPETGEELDFDFRPFELSTMQESNDQGTWYSWKIRPAEYTLLDLDNAAQLKEASDALFDSVQTNRVRGQFEEPIKRDSDDIEGEVM